MKSNLKPPTLLAAAVAVFCVGASCRVAAAEFPERQVVIVTPYAAGGAADVLARLLATKLEGQLKASVLVDNKPGAGTVIGAQAVARAKPDGHTLLLGASSTFSINPAIMAKLPYEPARDYQPIGMVGSVPLALMVNASVPAQTVAELVQLAKANPGKYAFSSFGNGTATHFAGELFNADAGIRMTHVPYRGSSAAMTDLVGGQVLVAFDTVLAGLPHAKSGKLRFLAVVGDKRSPLVPQVPTMAEAGYPGVDVVSWIALVGPQGMPADAVTKLEKGLAAVMAQPDTQERMRGLGYDVAYRAMPDWSKFVIDETARMRRTAERARITAD